MTNPETPPALDLDALLERFGDAYAAAYVEQTDASDARREEAAEAIRAALAAVTAERSAWTAPTRCAQQDCELPASLCHRHEGDRVAALERERDAAREQAKQAQATAEQMTRAYHLLRHEISSLHRRYRGVADVDSCEECSRVSADHVAFPCATYSALASVAEKALSTPTAAPKATGRIHCPLPGCAVTTEYEAEMDAHVLTPHGAAPQADEPGPVVWCNRCRELISPNRVAEHNASDAHRSREPKPLPAAAPDPAPTWRGMPIKACGFPRSHTNHVYDDGAGKTVCIGPLHATVTAPVPAGGETTTPATRCCPNHREPGEARYGCATAPGVTDPCCNECHYWVAWTRYLDGHDDEPAEPVPAGGEDGSGTADGGVLSPADARRITDAIWGGGEVRP